jgi:CubicO group peptidase (beta-lactamase class C family)
MAQHSRRSVLGMIGATASLAAGSTLLTGCTRTTGTAPPLSPPIPDLEPGGAFDRLVADMAGRDEFAGNVLVAHRGEPVLQASHGLADQANGTRHGPDTIYNIGSLTKLITAVAVVQLVSEGKLGLADSVGMHLDGFPTAIADTATVHHLLTHSGGMGNYRANPAWKAGDAVWATPEDNREGTLAIIRTEQPLYTPGTGSKYSNSGFYTLGAIVERVSGRTYWDYVRERIFAPAGMTRSDFATNQDVQAGGDFARPYGEPGPDGRRPDLLHNIRGCGIGGGAGGSYSTTRDLLAFARALQNDTLLPSVYTDVLLGGKTPSERGGSGMGAYGSSLAIINSHARLGHVGGADGIHASLYMYLDLDWVVITTSNYGIKEGLRPLIEVPDQLIAGKVTR